MSLGTAFIGAVLVLGMINNIARGIYESNYFPRYSKEEIKQKVIDWIVHMKQGQIVIPPDYMQHVNQIVQWALGNAMRSAMIFLMISLAIGAIFSIWLPNNPEKS